ncbi:hypothetical protein LB465_03095 [Salegentibacter sp. LM13S]|uniref:hypothetical protein n=1 Tax=Salegentibacter lacus TaxID=2873599 RepID=UPI001CCD1A14|nr:hypothetical protein [Salegentibacter lacus]MBZ9629753.1 hypothetical protein [Salegentibacter lacus]
MKKTFLSLALFLVSTYAFSCTCGQSLSSNFLNQVKKFDAIVEGKFYRDPVTLRGYIITNEVYKGKISNDTIRIYEGGTDCTEVFDEDLYETYIIGLYKVPDSNISDYYLAPSCVTSVLTVKDEVVLADHNLHIKPKISFFRSRMKRDRLVKKILNRL